MKLIYMYAYQWLTSKILGFYYALRYPLQDNKVCFLSDTRDVLGGNLECMYNYLDEHYEKVVQLKKDKRIQRSFKEQKELIYHLKTSKYILIDDLSLSISFLNVRKNQEVVQLWHGPGAFKKMGFSRIDNKQSSLKTLISKYIGHRNYTKVIVTSDDIKWCYEEAFNMKNKGEIKACGFPRCDVLLDKDYHQKIKDDFYSKYPEFKDKRMILFAPTYRGASIRNASYDFSKLDFKKIYDKYHKDSVFLIKWHPAIYNNFSLNHVSKPDLSEYSDFYYDLSDQRDLNDLLIVCDVLITDYSSVIFDYGLLNKPVIYFTYDLEDYTCHEGRGLYYPFYDYVYGSVTTTSDELIQAIEKNELHEEERKLFMNKFMNACDGTSTKKTFEWIFK